MIEQLMNVPKIVLQDRVQRRIAEQIVDFPALQGVEEPVFRAFSQDRVQQRGVEQEVLEMVFLAGDWWNAKMEMMADCWSGD